LHSLVTSLFGGNGRARILLFLLVHMIVLMGILIICLPTARRKSGPESGGLSGGGSGGSGGSPELKNESSKPKTDSTQPPSSDEKNKQKAATALTPESIAGDKCLSPSSVQKVRLNMAPPSTCSSSITPRLKPLGPASPKLEDEPNPAAVSHTGTRDTEKKRYGPLAANNAMNPSSSSDKSESQNKDGEGARQLSWHERNSNGASAEWIKGHYMRHGKEVPRDRPLCRLDVLQLERERREREKAQREAAIEEEARRKRKKRSKMKRSKNSRSRKSKNRKDSMKKELSGASSTDGTTQQLPGETEQEQGLYNTDVPNPSKKKKKKKKKKGPKKIKDQTTSAATVDNAIADPTEQAPADNPSETGRKDKPPKKPVRPNWSDAVPESQLPDDLTDFDESKKSKTKETKEKEDERPKIPDM
ncbi:hypothetical protein PMAYCL1PPCAC_24565, partial [Pristionchus mayeri]